jgi:hypothetical protein
VFIYFRKSYVISQKVDPWHLYWNFISRWSALPSVEYDFHFTEYDFVITCSDFYPLSNQINLFMVINIWGIIIWIIILPLSHLSIAIMTFQSKTWSQKSYSVKWKSYSTPRKPHGFSRQSYQSEALGTHHIY